VRRIRPVGLELAAAPSGSFERATIQRRLLAAEKFVQNVDVLGEPRETVRRERVAADEGVFDVRLLKVNAREA